MNSYVYTPWESILVKEIANAEKEIILICPFIKMAIFKKIISIIAGKNINLIIITRFTKQVFIQKSSDLDVITTAFNAKEFSIIADIYKLNNVHAKIFIIDKKIAYITSSNLTYSGLNVNYEIGVKIDNKDEIIHIIDKTITKNDKLARITNDDIIDIKKDLKTLLFKSVNDNNISIDEESNGINIGEQELLSDNTERIDESLECTENVYRKINMYLQREENRNYTFIDDYYLKSCIDEINLDADNTITTINNIAIRTTVAYNDFKYLCNYLKQYFCKFLLDKDIFEFALCFTHKSWQSNFFNDKCLYDMYNFYKVIGSYVHELYILKNLVKFRFFSTDSIGYYSILLREIISSYPYYKNLEEINLNFYLFRGDLKSAIDKDLYNIIIGFLYCKSNNSFDKLYNFLFSKADEYLLDYVITQNDYKSKVNAFFMQKYKKPITYRVVKKYGPQHMIFHIVEAVFNDKVLSAGEGSSRKKAEQNAAYNLIKKLNINISDIIINKNNFIHVQKYTISHERILKLENLKNIPISNIRILDICLTHKSILNQHSYRRSNDKLALIGSFVEQIFILLHRKEVQNRVWENMISNKNCTIDYFIHIYNRYKLDDYLDLGDNIEIIDSMRYTVIQAIIGAIYLEHNIYSVMDFFSDFTEMPNE